MWLLAGCAASVLPPPSWCGNEVIDMVPADGASDVYYRAPVRFDLRLPEPDPTVEVVGPDGVVPGTTEIDGAGAVWEGTLSPGTPYEATLTFGCGRTATTSWTTAGERPMPPFDPEGSTYTLDLGTGQSDALFVAFLAAEREADPLVALVDGGATLLVASDDGRGQPACLPTTRLDAAWAAPDLVATGGFQVATSAGAVRLEGVVLTATLTPEGEHLADGTLAADLAVDPFDALLDLDPGGACGLAAELGTPCAPCPSGDGQCVEVRIDGLTGVHQPSVELAPRTEAEIAADPACAAR